MVPPTRILDLIEAIEISAAERKYKLSDRQRNLISKLKFKAEKQMFISNNYWELLCNLFNEVEGRKSFKDNYEDLFPNPSSIIFLTLSTLIVFLIFMCIWEVVK